MLLVVQVLIEFLLLRRPLPLRPFLKRAELRAVGTTTVAASAVIVIAVVGSVTALSSFPEMSCGGTVLGILKVIVIVLI